MAKGKFSQPRGPVTSTPEPPQARKAPEDNWQPVQDAPLPEDEDMEVSTPAIEKNKKIVLISLCVLALVLVIGVVVTIGYLFGGSDDDGLILSNVHVAGINLGGMTPEDAEKVLHQATDLTYTSKDMVILLPDSTITLTPANTGASLDVKAAVEAAYQYGRTGGRAEREAARAQILTGEYHIALLSYLSLDTTYIRRQLDDYGADFNSTYAPSSFTMQGEMPALDAEHFDKNAVCQTLILNPGAPGRHLDMDALYNRVLDAYSFNQFEVDARNDAPEEAPEPLDLAAIFEEFCVEAVDASMDMETFEVTPESYGYAFDLERAQELLSEAAPGADIGIPMQYVIPQVLGDELEELLFRDVLASYKTEHTNNENRNNNLRLACAAINGYVMMPGDEFSYNTVVGKRTAEAGYLPAAAYSGGQTVNELGGGICQVSSTLYYCTLLADLDVTVRQCHSYPSSYIPLGMDATVSWGGPEFKFINNTRYPIRLEAEVSDGYVKIQIIGTDEKDYYVEMEYNIISTKNYDTIYEEYPENNAKGYKDGQIIQSPYTGYTVKTYKCRYDKETGELIERVYEDTSVYKSRDKIIAKIIKDEPTEPPTDAPATPPETDPPVTDPPATDPPATDAPVTNPPAEGQTP